VTEQGGRPALPSLVCHACGIDLTRFNASTRRPSSCRGCEDPLTWIALGILEP
jgi:hypothetical protein